ncbi:MAG: D-aminoacyl-tRNA deacylase [Chloroflexales bacterium]
MRVIIQRVSQASVEVEGRIVGSIGAGLLVLIGIGQGDGEAEAQLLAEKTARLRIFADDEGHLDRSLIDVGGAALVISQFTLYADTRRGRRPSFTDAAPPEVAAPLVESYAATLRALGVQVESGIFGFHMRVTSTNDGPVTISLDSELFSQPRR